MLRLRKQVFFTVLEMLENNPVTMIPYTLMMAIDLVIKAIFGVAFIFNMNITKSSSFLKDQNFLAPSTLASLSFLAVVLVFLAIKLMLN
jgi:hypothetical protein